MCLIVPNVTLRRVRETIAAVKKQ